METNMVDGQSSVAELPAKADGPAEPMTLSQGIDDIADLLDDQGDDLDTVPGHEENAGDPKFVDDEDQPVDGDAPEDAVDDEQEPDDEPQPDPYDKGRFASDNAKVTLPDGTVTTVAELKNGNLRQRDYSKKTEEVARERERIQAQDQEVARLAEQTKAEREYLLWYAQQYAPQPPTRPTSDPSVNPMDWIVYNKQVEDYNGLAQNYHQMVQQQQAAQQAEAAKAEEASKQQLQAEYNRMIETFPVLKDREKFATFWSEIDQAGQKYYRLQPGDLPNMLRSVELVQLARDAMRYRANKDRSPVVQKEITAKPRMVQGSQRANPDQQRQRSTKDNVQRLKQSGSLKDGIAALMDMDL